MPWVVASALSPITSRWLAIFLFLQICGHPIVMAQCIVAEVIVAYSLSGLTPLQLVRRGLMPSIAAVVLSAPFWLPQGLWQGLILGPRALPASFVDTFLGSWISSASITCAPSASGCRWRRSWWWSSRAPACRCSSGCRRSSAVGGDPAAGQAVLSDHAAHPDPRPVDLRVAARAAGGRSCCWAPCWSAGARRRAPRAGCRVLASLAMLGMAFVMLQFPGGVAKHLSWQDDRVAITEFERLDGIWGVTRVPAAVQEHPGRMHHARRAAGQLPRPAQWRRGAGALHPRAAGPGRPGRL